MVLLLRGLWFPPQLFAWQDAELSAERGHFRRQDGDSAFGLEWPGRALERRLEAR